jgi:hypothetical protein
MTYVIFNIQEFAMSKRKASKVSSKQAGGKVAAKAQRASQAVVRSPKPRHLRSVAPTSAESSTVLSASPDAAVFETPATATSVPEKATMASQDNGQPRMRQTDLMKALSVFSATTNVAAFQRKLPELAQAYMQLGFEFAQRLSQIKSPFEFASVFAELATKQFALVQTLVIPKQSSR